MNRITWVGMDVHKASVSVCMAVGDSKDFVQWQVVHKPAAIEKMVRKIAQAAPGEIRLCYEAGPTGYGLKRRIESLCDRAVCEVVAPSLIPVRSGDRVKTDRKDALKLCGMLRSQLLTEVVAPTLEEEAARALCRRREAVRQDVTRTQNRLTKFLLCEEVHYSAGQPWTKRYRLWLQGVRFQQAGLQIALDDLRLELAQAEERLKTLDQHLTTLAQSAMFKPIVGALRCFRGIDTITALGLATELYQPQRFASARDMMAYVGLTPSEYSTGTSERRGGITKTGNKRVRKYLVESAHHYRHRPSVSKALRARRVEQPSWAIAIADKAQHRLYRRRLHLRAVGKQTNKITVALARELAGFIWDVMQHVAANGTPTVEA